MGKYKIDCIIIDGVGYSNCTYYGYGINEICAIDLAEHRDPNIVWVSSCTSIMKDGKDGG